MNQSEVQLNEIRITDCHSNSSATSLFIVGKLSEGNRFAGSQVNFSQETGIVTINLYKYTTPTFFGTEDFAVMIDISDASPNEIWVQDSSGNLQETVSKSV